MYFVPKLYIHMLLMFVYRIIYPVLTTSLHRISVELLVFTVNVEPSHDSSVAVCIFLFDQILSILCDFMLLLHTHTHTVTHIYIHTQITYPYIHYAQWYNQHNLTQVTTLSTQKQNTKI